MDSDNDTRKFKLMAGVVLVFIISLATSCQELKYTLWGKTVDADVLQIQEVMVKVGKWGGEQPRMRVEYTYRDNGSLIKASDKVPVGWELGQAKPGGTIGIEYLSGDKFSSRLTGHRNLTGVAVFVAMLVILVGLIIKYSWDAKRPA